MKKIYWWLIDHELASVLLSWLAIFLAAPWIIKVLYRYFIWVSIAT